MNKMRELSIIAVIRQYLEIISRVFFFITISYCSYKLDFVYFDPIGCRTLYVVHRFSGFAPLIQI